MAPKRIPPKVRLLRRVKPDEHSSCLIYTGYIDRHGYGLFSGKNGRTVQAHRFVYEMTSGPIPEGSVVMHSCNRPKCLNPLHLRAGSNAENLQYMSAQGRGVKSRSGLPFGANHVKDFPRKKPYRAGFRHNNKSVYLGYYATAEEASAVATAARDAILTVRHQPLPPAEKD